MDITTSCSDGNEKLLSPEYNLTLPYYQPHPRRSRCLDSFYIILAVVSIVTCIISCFCAVYCHQVLAEEKTVENFDTTQPGISAPLVSPTEASDHSQADLQFSFDSGVDYDIYSGIEESETDEYDEGYFDEDEDDSDEDEDIEGSGFTDFNDDEDVSEHVRERRAASTCEDKCKARGKTGRKLRRCTNKCEVTKKKQSRKQTQSRKSKQSGEAKQTLNLPAAHFEARFSDNEIQNLVRVDYNHYENREDVPLKIFKPAHWVDSKTTPVNFNSSVAEAKSSGVYFVYAQVSIGGKQPEKSITVVQKRSGTEVNALSCNNGVHPDHNDSYSAQRQTCSVLGLMNVQIGDTIEVQNNAANADITLDKDKTYFGIIQLSAVAPKESRTM